jgi:hypothetical protein
MTEKGRTKACYSHDKTDPILFEEQGTIAVVATIMAPVSNSITNYTHLNVPNSVCVDADVPSRNYQQTVILGEFSGVSKR